MLMIMVTDKRYLEVLSYLKDERCDVNFKIICKQDILAALPENRQMTEDELNAVLKALEGKQYITVKFNDETEICVNLTSKGSAEVQEAPAVEAAQQLALKVPKKQPYFLIGIICFVASFLGALAGVIVGKFI